MKKIWLIYLTLSVITVILHNKIVDEPYEKDRLKRHQEVISHTAPSPDQYRPLIFLASEYIQKVGMSFKNSYLFIRLFFTFFSLILFHKFLNYWFDDRVSLIGGIILAASLPLTYLWYFMQEGDLPNLFFFIFGFILIKERKNILFLILLCVSMFNRETAIMLLFVWIFYNYGEMDFKKFFLWGFICAISGIGIYYGIRQYYGVKPYYSEFFWLKLNLKEPRTYIYTFLLFGGFLIWAFKNFSGKPKFLKSAAHMIPFFLSVHLLFTRLMEIRLLLPLFPIIIPLGLISVFSTDKNQVLSCREVYDERMQKEKEIKNAKLLYVLFFVGFLGFLYLFYHYTEKKYLKDYRTQEKVKELIYGGVNFLNRGEKENALRKFQEAVLINPDNPDIHYNLAVIYTSYIVDKKKALEHFERCFLLNPEHSHKEIIKKEIERLKRK